MREMKDSGIEWIGSIPKVWRTIPHKYVMHKEKSICEKYNGEDIISLTMNGVIVRDLTAGGKMPATFDGYQYVEPDDLLLCLFDIDVTPRCVGIVRNKGITSPAYSRFKVHSGYYNKYYDYLLRFIDDEKVFVHLAKNLRNSLTETDFGTITTIVPPFPEQEKIANFLDQKCSEIDALSSEISGQISNLEEYKKSVITEAVTKGVRADRTMKDSGVEYNDFIPREWNEAKLKYLVYLRARLGWRGLKADEYVDNGFIFLSAFNIINNKLDFSEVNYINQFRYDESPEIKLKSGDVLIVKDGAGIGKCAYVDYMPRESTPNGSLAVITPNDKLYGKYLYYYFLSSMFQERILQLKDGMGVPHLFQGDMREILIPVPNVEEQQEIANYLDQQCSEVDALIEEKKEQLATLEEYKKSLIYEYVTGKKEIK